MATFKKYQSIENSYNAKHISNLPDSVKNAAFAVSEKLDGSNIQIVFNKDEAIRLGRREDFIGEDESFNDIRHIIKNYDQQLAFFQNLADTSGREIRLYGEIYGEGINKRINYGKGKHIQIFDIEIDGKLWSVAGIYNLIQQNPVLFLEFFVPQAMVANLTEALAIDVELLDEATGRPLTEGIVIKPYGENYFDKRGNRLILKKKSKAFNDVEGSPIPKAKKELPPLIIELNDLFVGHINENRMIDAFSKHGEIADVKEIGKFIKIILEDAKLDFLSAYGERLKELEKPEDEKLVFNVGSKAAMLLQTHLASNG